MEPVELAKRALLDINWLLVEGFDCNVRTVQIEGVKGTVAELIAYITLHDPDWEIPGNAD